MQSVGTKVLPRLLSRFRDERPGIALVPLETFDHAELARAVETGRFDLSFAPMPVRRGPVRGPPDPRRPVRPARPLGLPAGGQHVGDAAPGRPAAADRLRRPGPAGRAGAAPAADRARAGHRLPVQRQPDRAGLRRRRPGLRPDAAAHRGRGRPGGRRRPHRDRAAGPPARRHLARRPPAAAVGAPLHRAGRRGLRRPQPWLDADAEGRQGPRSAARPTRRSQYDGVDRPVWTPPEWTGRRAVRHDTDRSTSRSSAPDPQEWTGRVPGAATLAGPLRSDVP